MADQTVAPDSSDSAGLADACRRLAERLSGTNPSWYEAELGGRTRAERLRVLVRRLVELGRDAGAGTPDGAVPRDVGPHALADQVVVLVGDIRGAPGVARVAPTAEHAIRRCYDDLWPPLRP